MRLFLTGGSGFVGKNIIEQLGEKYEILAPSHAELELLDDAAVKVFFEKHEIDVVIHSAVRPGHRNAKEPTNQLYNNCRMFFNLVRNESHFKKLILLSSGAAYDQLHAKPKMKEDSFDRYVPADEGGFSKYIEAKYIEGREKIVELRVFGIFGKYEDYAIRFVSNMLCKAIFDLPLTMKQNRKFDYVYADDLMPVLEYFINKESQHNAYNVTPDSAIELYSLAEKVLEIAGKKLPIIVKEPGLGVEYSGESSRLKKELGTLPFRPIEDAIADLYHWYLKNKDSINKDFLLVDK